jgi:hypothetical protein
MAHHDWLFVRGGEWLRKHDGVRLTLRVDGWHVTSASGARAMNPGVQSGTFANLEAARVACDAGALAPDVLPVDE